MGCFGIHGPFLFVSLPPAKLTGVPAPLRFVDLVLHAQWAVLFGFLVQALSNYCLLIWVSLQSLQDSRVWGHSIGRIRGGCWGANSNPVPIYLVILAAPPSLARCLRCCILHVNCQFMGRMRIGMCGH